MRLLQHTLLLGWYSACDEQSWFPTNMMLRIEVHQTRQYYFSQSEGPLGVFLLNLSVFSLMHCDDIMGQMPKICWKCAPIRKICELLWKLQFAWICDKFSDRRIAFIRHLYLSVAQLGCSLNALSSISRPLLLIGYKFVLVLDPTHFSKTLFEKWHTPPLRRVCLSKSYPFNWICHRLHSLKV